MQEITLKDAQKYLIEAMDYFHDFCQKNKLKYFLLGGSVLGAIRHKGFIPWDDDIDVGLFRSDYEIFKSKINEYSKEYEVRYIDTHKNIPAPVIRICFKNIFFAKNNQKDINDDPLLIDIFPLDNVPLDTKKQEKQEKKLLKYKKILYLKHSYAIPKNKIKAFGKRLVRIFYGFLNNEKIIEKYDAEMSKYNNETTNFVCSMASQYSYIKQTFHKNIYGDPILFEFEKRTYYLPQKYNEYLMQLYGDYMRPSERKTNTTHIYKTETKKWNK